MLETCASEGIDCLRFAGMPPGDDRSFGARKIPTLSIAILPAAEAHQLWLMLHARNAGLEKGFVSIGRVVNEAPGMQVCADWLKTIVPDVPVRFVPAGDPYWRPL